MPIYASFNTDEQTYLKYAGIERGRATPVFLGLMTEDGFPRKGRLTFIDNALDACECADATTPKVKVTVGGCGG